VVLVQADRLHAETAQGCFGGAAHVGGVAVHRPATTAGADVAAFGGDQDRAAVTAPRRQRFGHKHLAVARVRPAQAVGVGGVDQGHPGVQGGMDGLNGTCFIGTPFDGHGHLAEADRSDLP
jgi:hypothetical protein